MGEASFELQTGASAFRGAKRGSRERESGIGEQLVESIAERETTRISLCGCMYYDSEDLIAC